MLSNKSNKELVEAGHQFAKALDADMPLTDIAKLVSALSTRLDCAIVRGDDLQQKLNAVPSLCDGKEQCAFEAWAKGNGFDMREHPLHWLFLDEKTYAARQAWSECLRYSEQRISSGSHDTANKAGV
ncbi:hypothetical protein NB724_001368 [Pantoea ananatis]|uniref:hypothetical protein n=1 Tax=Pantoea ananas TaxID=553 RepID=UPI0021F79E84|nr:hypothetical protein [Pantoea ananatis]MCW0316217.1 hypothetical protein [Pantoea ananatis]MCW0334357.1 hypothetical protein [Pantoea ananatis]MCW0382674.1 hypothetical protein [Pantoea ananatis]MCW0407338.1 hypothetical protein [Pantoea ananatis]MCW0427374.1 hypothetical protein [Pantoea ananatis]